MLTVASHETRRYNTGYFLNTDAGTHWNKMYKCHEAYVNSRHVNEPSTKCGTMQSVIGIASSKLLQRRRQLQCSIIHKSFLSEICLVNLIHSNRHLYGSKRPSTVLYYFTSSSHFWTTMTSHHKSLWLFPAFLRRVSPIPYYHHASSYIFFSLSHCPLISSTYPSHLRTFRSNPSLIYYVIQITNSALYFLIFPSDHPGCTPVNSGNTATYI